MKTFNDYYQDHPENKFRSNEEIKWCQTIDMLNDLSKKIEDLDKDNDLLRGEINRLHKKIEEQDKKIQALDDQVVLIAESLKIIAEPLEKKIEFIIQNVDALYCPNKCGYAMERRENTWDKICPKCNQTLKELYNNQQHEKAQR